MSQFNGRVTEKHLFIPIAKIVLPAVILAALFAFLLCGAGNAAAGETEIRVGSELEFPPYAFIDEQGEPTGFSVDLIRAVADAMGLSIRISSGPWDTVWNDLVAGRLDVLPVVARLPERTRLVDFGLPHTETFDAFFVRRGDDPIQDIRGAEGKEIVVMRSDAAHHALLERNFQGKLVLVNTIPEGLSLVAAGKHDAFLCSKLIGTLAMRDHGIKGLSAGPPIPDYKRVFSFAVKKGDTELLEKLNQGLMIIKINGEYERLYEKWLSVDDPWTILEKYLAPAVAVLITVALIAGIWMMMLQQMVRRRTRELAETNVKLRQAQEELEERVEQRTVELTQTNKALQTEIAERKRAEELSKHLASFPQLNPNPILETDFSGQITYSNPAVQNVLRDIGLDKNDTHVFLPGDFDDIIKKLAEKPESTLSRDVEIRDRIFGATFHIVPKFDVVRIYATDVTERKKVEAENIRTREEWERTFNSVPDLIAILDRNYRFVRVNRAMAEMMGTEADKCIGMKCFSSVHGTSGPPAVCPHKLSMEDGREHMAEVREDRFKRDFLVTTTPLFDKTGEIMGSVHVARDITERKQAEEALRQSEAQLKRSEEIAHLGSWDLDLVRNVLTWSDEVYRIFGLHPQEFPATYDAFLEAVHPDDRAAVDEAYKGSLQEGKDSYEIVHRIVKNPTGEIRHVHEKCEHTRDESGRIVRSVGMVHDITDRKEAEEKIRASLEEKELLLREIHHRVKNNMTVVFSLLKLQSKHVKDERDRKLFEDSMARIKSMALIHEKLYRTGNLAEINFRDYIKELAGSIFMSYRIPTGRIHLKTDVDNVSLGIDTAIPCGLIVNELLSNSLKYAFPDGISGELRVSLHEISGPGTNDEGLLAASEVELIVSDNGAGMPETIDIRTSDSLGLNLVNAFVKQLRGKIEMSRENGTEFRIRFEKRK